MVTSSSPVCSNLPVTHSSNPWRSRPRPASATNPARPSEFAQPLASHPPISTGDSRNCPRRRYESLFLAFHVPSISSRSPCQKTGMWSARHNYLQKERQRYSTDGVNESTLCKTSHQACLASSPKSPPTVLFLPSPSTHFTVRKPLIDRIYHVLRGI